MVSKKEQAGMICDHCGSGELVRGVKLSQPHEAGDMGLQYRTSFFLVGTETLYADLCNDCGTIQRFYVKNTDQKWITG